MNTLKRVKPEKIDVIWSVVIPYIEMCLKKTKADADYSIEDIHNKIQNNLMQLWVSIQDNIIIGVCCTQLIRSNKRLRLELSFASSDLNTMKNWLYPNFNIMQQFAKDQNCKVITIQGRPGWIKIFKKHIQHIETVLYIEV